MCLQFGLGYALHVRYADFKLFDPGDFVPILKSDKKRGTFISWPFFEHYVLVGLSKPSKKGGRDGVPSNVTKKKVETLSELYNKMQKFAGIMWSLKKRHFNRGQAARVTEAAGVCIFSLAEG